MSTQKEIVLITGVSGFIGSRILLRLLKEENSENRIFRIFVRPSSNLIASIGYDTLKNNKNIDITYGKLEKAEDVHRFFEEKKNEKITHVFHSAAQGFFLKNLKLFSGGDWGHYDIFYKANFMATKNIVDECLNLKYLQHYIHLSSVDVYRQDKETKECDETHPHEAERFHGYSRTKALADEYVIDMHKKQKLPMTILRPAVVYGERSYSWGLQEARIIHKGWGFLVSGSNFKSGATHVDDVVDCVIKAYEKPKISIGEIYNVCDPNSPTWKEYFDVISDGIGKPRVVWSIPFWFAFIVAYLFECVYHWMGWLDDRPLLTLFALYLVGRAQEWPSDKAIKDLGWKPKVQFKEGMKEVIHWLKESGEYLD
jgi:nucleoside-diphosphate-sugar epimerase